MLSAIKYLTFCILYSILNADFIKTHSSAAGFFPLSVWLLSTAVLGKKLKAASCLVYCILGLAVSWLDMLAGVFATMSSDEFKNGKKILPFHLKRELNRELKAL